MSRAVTKTLRGLLAPILLVITSPAFAALSAILTEPADGEVFPAGSTITVSANATSTQQNRPIANVEFIANCLVGPPETGNVHEFPIGSDTTAPYSVLWSDPLFSTCSRTFTLFAKATDSHGATAISTPRTIRFNDAPSVSLTAPANNAVFNAPATITLTASASDADGTVAKVDFFHGGTNLIATLTSAPYTFNWTNVAAGSYTLTAKATDNLNETTTSAPVNMTVNPGVAQLFFIHADHLNTPRLIANQSQQAVWRWDQQEPFGVNVPDENPSSLGIFDFPLRFPGQYADKETGLHYNYFRDYDPSIGRYGESDPIGLRGGLNTYSYAKLSPLLYMDSSGLLVCEGNWHKEMEVILGGVPSVTMCRCYWRCKPCRGTDLWSGEYMDLPSTTGLPIYDTKNATADDTSDLNEEGPNVEGAKKQRRGPRAGKAVSGPKGRGGVGGGAASTGNWCLCKFPGDETGCPEACYADGTIGQASRTR